MTDFIPPKAGDGCTIQCGSDSYGATITFVRVWAGGYVIDVQEDKATPAEGHDYYSAQKWEHSRNERGRCFSFRYEDVKPDRGWREITFTGKNASRTKYMNSIYRLSLNGRNTYQDPHR